MGFHGYTHTRFHGYISLSLTGVRYVFEILKDFFFHLPTQKSRVPRYQKVSMTPWEVKREIEIKSVTDAICPGMREDSVGRRCCGGLKRRSDEPERFAGVRKWGAIVRMRGSSGQGWGAAQRWRGFCVTVPLQRPFASLLHAVTCLQLLLPQLSFKSSSCVWLSQASVPGSHPWSGLSDLTFLGRGNPCGILAPPCDSSSIFCCVSLSGKEVLFFTAGIQKKTNSLYILIY